MGEIVNLRRARKRKTREEAAKAADAARVRFGLSAAEREAAASEQDRQAARLDGHRRDGADEPKADERKADEPKE